MTNSSNSGRPFYGKYRGRVTDNVDPLSKGRIRATVTDIYGDNKSGWAMPSTPFAGKGVGLFMIPPEKAWVWIEFEHGDPDYPIWSGCFWEENEVPAFPAVPEKKILKTKAGTITIDETPGSEGITIETKSKMKIVLNNSGIEITNGTGKINLSSQKVSINDNALEVT